jgi:hypothetical protein
LFDSEISIGGLTIWLPGVRLALWLAAAIIVIAGFAALASLRAGQRVHSADRSPHPSRGAQSGEMD